jgi:hypothetical protein
MANQPKFFDLYELSEDERIRAIADTVKKGLQTAFIVDDEPKADRYLAKIRALVRVRVIRRGAGPTPGAYTVQIGPEPL